jgi:uncharacterized protein (TIGR03118 family)
MALTVLAGVAAPASAHGRSTRFKQIDQVSNQPNVANLTDPDVVNAWGLALGPDTPLWVANNGTDTATLYSGGVRGEPVEKVPLTVSVPGGPTGEVFNDTDQFPVRDTGQNMPARFIWVTESGDVLAWNQQAGTDAVVVAHVDTAIYKGATILHTESGPFLLAADFHNARIDVFDENFQLLDLPDFFFADDRIPEGFAPFNLLAVDEKVFVTYAKQDENAEDDVPGVGLGFVNLFKNFGTEVRRIASRGTLNAPWGLTIAPEGFGRFTGDLLVGNFGDGLISAFDGKEFEGLLKDKKGDPIQIDGLWSLLPGTETTGGEGTLWFSAGPDDETNGLVGQLIPKKKKRH